MDTRKITIVATVIVIALIFAGIGYAYTAYTTNEGNSTDTAFITVVQKDSSGADDYTFADNKVIKFDTYNEQSSSNIYYKLSSEETPVTITIGESANFTCVELGDVNLVATYAGNDVAPLELNVDLLASTGFEANNNWVYFITNGATGADQEIYAYKNTAASTSTWIDGPDALILERAPGDDVKNYAVKNIKLYYGYPSVLANMDFDSTVTELQDFLRVSNPPQELQNAKVTFKTTDVKVPADKTAVDSYAVTYNGNGNQYVVLVEKDTSYTLLGFNETNLGVPENMAFKEWHDESGNPITSPIAITEDVSVTAIYE